MKQILITGVAGFIGSHTAKKLLDLGYNVVGIDNFDPFYSKDIKEKNLNSLVDHHNFNFFDLDISTEDFELAVANNNIDTIIHLAARAGVRPSFQFPTSYVDHDIRGTVNILEAMKKFEIENMIFGSSSSVYGNLADLPYKENLKLNKPISPYAAAKLSSEMFNYVYHSQYEFNVTNLRLFTVYGPRQRPEMGIHKFTRLIHNDKPIQMYGNGESTRDYTYIDDIVDGIVLSLNKVDGYHIYNLGNGNPVKLQDLIQLLSEKIGKKANIVEVPGQSGDVDHTLADLSKSERELGYSPRFSIDKGLDQFLSWYYQSNSDS